MPGQPAAWYKNAVFYEVSVRAFRDTNGDGIGDINGVAQKLDYLKQLGIDCIWLNPIYPSPLRDDGYDISDYCAINPDYGTLEDFSHLVKEIHRLGLRLITDLVVNHTSDQHPWFQSARSSPDSPYRDFYVWSDTDQKYKDARIIFLDTEKSNWTWDPKADRYFWHRFYSHQPDLNFDSSRVRGEMLKVVKFWLDLGVDGFRVDAVPYMFEREGTSCENLPETHAYLKEIRKFVDQQYPGRILLCEANQWPQDVVAYFSEGNEFHMAFHFPLMPRIFMALKKGDGSPIRWVFDNTPPIPSNTQWCTFLRNHDELTLEMVNNEERKWIWQEYAPEPRMRLNLGIRRRLAPLLNNNQALLELAHSLLFTLPGSPIIYYGDEIGMGDDIWLPDRNGVRTPMQWDTSLSAGFSLSSRLYLPVIDKPPYGYQIVNVASQRANPKSLWHAIHTMIELRKEHSALSEGDLDWIDTGSDSILAFFRRVKYEELLLVHNLSTESNEIVLYIKNNDSFVKDLISRQTYPIKDNQLYLNLMPYQSIWIIL